MIESLGTKGGSGQVFYKISHYKSGDIYEVGRSYVTYKGDRYHTHMIHNPDDDRQEPDYDKGARVVDLRSRDDYDKLVENSRGLSQRRLVQVAQAVLHEYITAESAQSSDGKIKFKELGDPPIHMYLNALKSQSVPPPRSTLLAAANGAHGGGGVVPNPRPTPSRGVGPSGNFS